VNGFLERIGVAKDYRQRLKKHYPGREVIKKHRLGKEEIGKKTRRGSKFNSIWRFNSGQRGGLLLSRMGGFDGGR